MRLRNDLHTQRHRIRDSTGSLNSMSTMSSMGMLCSIVFVLLCLLLLEHLNANELPTSPPYLNSAEYPIFAPHLNYKLRTHSHSLTAARTMNAIWSTLQYWLVDHPSILHFSWAPGQTPASTPLFLTLSLLSYLSLTFLLTRPPLFTINPALLKPITAVHNLLLFLLSLIMAVGCTLSILSPDTPSLDWILCFPPHISPTGPHFFWAYIFYLSKFLEFLDTLFIILSGSIQRLTFLHVYHHATVLVMCYLWLRTCQSLFPVALVTNASVHVLMYGYYFLCAVGIRPKWKRVVTDCQIVQFLFSFAVSGRMLYLHFSGSGCSGIWGWCFNAVFNASLLSLFVDFHVKSYAKRKKMGQKDKGS